MTGNVLVFDVGKTHVKLAVVDGRNTVIAQRSRDNDVVIEPPYPHFDITTIWDWFVASCREIAAEFEIGAVIATTHGSCAALVDPDRPGDGLTLPVMDYEFAEVNQLDADYEPLRTPYERSFSPSLPGGLNLGRQLFWLQRRHADTFADTAAILLYPQYWAWRLSGQLASEVTSIGCHSDLWEPRANGFSSLAAAQGWAALFPAFVPAWQSLGEIAPEVAAATGLPRACRIYPGMHDSNAGLFRYRRTRDEAPFTLVSTGTWVVSMAVGPDLDCLDERRDMLANVDATGEPVACARFMGGREYAAICAARETAIDTPVDDVQLADAVAGDCVAYPEFSGGAGPFGGREPDFSSSAGRASGTVLATLYSALMIDYELDLLGARGEVIIEGVFANNLSLCGILAQLRARQPVSRSAAGSDVQLGAALATRATPNGDGTTQTVPCAPAALPGLADYRQRWRERLASRVAT